MTAASILQFVLYGAVLLALTPLLGGYMARVFAGERVFLTPVLGPVEGLIYGLCGVRADREQHWTAYTAAMLAFNLLGMLLLYALLRLQAVLPLNPADMPPVAAHVAFNTAVSFTSNTNWQVYGGEVTLGYLAQMAGLTVQNFVSAATGIALLLALIRGFARRSSCTVGNFYVDLVRATLYLLLPLSLVGALFLVWQGVPQNLNDYVAATTVEGGQQIIAQGPVASQVVIKQLGTNGGGFFNVNSAHPYENPTPPSNFFQVLCILLIPAAQVYMFGRMVGDVRQGWALCAVMAAVFVAFLGVTYWAETRGNPVFEPLGVTMAATDLQAGGNMEGKEVRHGVAASALWAVVTTAASNGSVNAMLDSFTPIGGMMPLANIMLGEQIFGGVGTGLYGMLIFVVLTVFIAGLMVGRTPEYLGKKIEAREVKLAVLAILTLPVGILGLGGLAAALPIGVEAVQDPGPHGLSEILYAYSSGTGNNGSAFAGFGAATPYHATMVGLAMLIGRYLFVIPMMAVAGSLAAKKTVPASGGTFPTHTPLFVVLLIGVIVIVGGLTFFPALALGPIAEELALRAGRLF